MERSEKVTKSFTLLPMHVAIIAQVAKDNGQSSDSAALRFILDEWVELKDKEWRTKGPPAPQ